MTLTTITDDAQERVSRVDMHCHSTASQVSKLGVQRAAGLPECATPPEEVYALAKRRGMDFVTITDHDTIDGAMRLADRPDVFVSEELTAGFRGEPAMQVHVLCYDITPDDHDWLQAHAHDVELCAAYMFERDIACALAHPYYIVGATPLTARHRRRLSELFPVWETRNGARAPELNRPAATYVATRDSIGIGGSDDHAGVDIGRTYTQAPAAATPQEFLAHMRAGRVRARGAQGSAAKWAHAAIVLAARSLEPGEPRVHAAHEAADALVGVAHGASEERVESDGTAPQPPHPALDPDPSPTRARRDRPASRPDPQRVMAMVRRLLREGDARQGATGAGGAVSPEDARCLLRAWLAAVELDHLDTPGLIAYMQDESFSHADLYRRACRLHERKLRSAVELVLRAARGEAEVGAAAEGVFEGCIAAIPYAPATAFLASEQSKLARLPFGGERETPRVAILADGIGSTHGVTRTIEEIRARGVAGYEIEVVATDPEVDRRLSAVAEIDVPYYPGLRIGVPSLPAAVQTLADGAFDAIHVCSPGPAGAAGVLLARALGLPLIGSYHTELTAYADLRSGRPELAGAMAMAVSAFYRACDIVLSPSAASDDALAEIGMPGERVMRWDRGVDTSRFDRSLRDPALLAGGPNDAINVMYSGRITREKGAELLADTFLRARAREPRLHLVLAGGGPEQERLRERVGPEHTTFLGWLSGSDLARAYACADMFLFPSATDTFGQVILEAQASGLPVIAVAEGGPLSLIEHRVSGLLCEADAEELAGAVLEVAGSPLLRERLTVAGLASVRGRTWERALARLGEGYARVLSGEAGAHAVELPRAA
ncbi:MAG TPA: glycosyltransferase [Solirubrobacteraceae bacterium]|jgi:glycosyltransferase involved in cell wall biosynthesis/predicted metal-dependent phosphoesterase TrpH|nr:glycosyltransferase [Solirubrobacteraceae bacterium]